MAHGWKVRSPLLDHRFMEFAAQPSAGVQAPRGDRKYIFKQAVRHLLPPEIVAARKMGFGVPLEHWFRNELREMAYDILLAARMPERGYFRPGVGQPATWTSTSQGSHDWHDQLWNLLMLELWHRTFIDSPVVSRPSDAPSLATTR